MKLIESPYLLDEKQKHVGKLATLENATIVNIQLATGEEVAEHDTPKEVMIVVRKGAVRFTVEGQEVVVSPENVLHLNPLEKHSLVAIEPTDLLVFQITPSK